MTEEKETVCEECPKGCKPCYHCNGKGYTVWVKSGFGDMHIKCGICKGGRSLIKDKNRYGISCSICKGTGKITKEK